MKIKGIIAEDFVNYKKPSMFIGFPTCTWKCEKECGIEMCQNKGLAHSYRKFCYQSSEEPLPSKQRHKFREHRIS